MGQIEVNLRLAACGTAELVRGKGGLEILKTMRVSWKCAMVSVN